MTSRNEEIDETVEHLKLIKVFNVWLELIVEATVSERIENFFALVNRLIWKNYLFDLVVGLDQDSHIEWVQDFVIRKQSLKFEKSNFLHRFWWIEIKAVVNDVNSQIQICFNCITFSWSTTFGWYSLTSSSSFLVFHIFTFLSQEMAHTAEAWKHSDCKFKTLSFDFPVFLRWNFINFFGDI